MTTTIAFTGHRPQDLPTAMGYAAFADALNALGVGNRSDLTFVVGGALGTDSWAATYALIHDIPFHLVLPYTPEVMGRFWTEQQRAGLWAHIYAAETVTVLNGGDRYVGAGVYQRRNEVMVDNADVVFALWSGKRKGGTWNCVQYAAREGRPTYNLWPLTGKLRPIPAGTVLPSEEERTDSRGVLDPL